MHTLISKKAPTTLTSQSGMALLTVLIIVFLASTLAVSMVTQHSFDIRRTDYNKNFGQGYHLGLGVEAWALGKLHKDITTGTQGGQTDHLNESWNDKLTLRNINNIANVDGYISDSQAKFNINNLRFEADKPPTSGNKDTKPVAAHYLYFRRLLKSLDINPDLANPIVDWVDKDSNSRFPLGAEDADYLAKKIPYRTAGRPISRISELRLVKGVTNKIFKKLASTIIALPTNTRININTASKKVLLGLIPDMTNSMAETIIQQRLTTPFKTTKGFIAFLKLDTTKNAAVIAQLNSIVSVNSEYFIAHANISLNRSQLTMSCLIWRDASKGVVKVYQRSRRKQ
ncbi:hypothetical protein MNBD_GAMMA12-3363 [hydrothermal vent metagenome]|uniref:General secretion pathway protein K n=1 Tax=hydrothermal vent metagenome TaxID=652676 RepID=A0A3B0YAV0_9ZZZZ